MAVARCGPRELRLGRYVLDRGRGTFIRHGIFGSHRHHSRAPAKLPAHSIDTISVAMIKSCLGRGRVLYARYSFTLLVTLVSALRPTIAVAAVTRTADEKCRFAAPANDKYPCNSRLIFHLSNCEARRPEF